ncbi:MAG: SDR family oxidoreductase [Oscillospiraceae bacterium]|nr:SDR family oxidoreductase [Oscillospiraceae bacterium]
MEKQKRALVTGASRGIGRAIAIALAEDGYEVILHCVNGIQQAQEVKTTIENAGGKANILTADLCDPAQAKAMAQQMGDVDVLVLNVSIQIRKPWQEITLEEANAQINCNFLSSLTLIQEAVPYMETQKWGRIITIGSVQEAKPHPDMLIYSSIKAAQTAMVKSLSLQLAKDGITVNNVAPGVIYTDRNREALADPDYAKKVSDSIPAGYYGEPEDCAGIVSLLCSEKGRYITGQSIFVDGGKSVQ